MSDEANHRLDHAVRHAKFRKRDREKSSRQLAKRAGCVIYFIQAGKFIKVGITRLSLLKFRINAIQTGNPYPIKVLRLLHTSRPRADERLFHHVLKPFHVRGEWFLIDSPAIMELLAGVPQPLP